MLFGIDHFDQLNSADRLTDSEGWAEPKNVPPELRLFWLILPRLGGFILGTPLSWD